MQDMREQLNFGVIIDMMVADHVDYNDIDNCKIEWLEGTSEISKTDIEAKISSMEYISKRRAEYPSMADQLDDIYHNGVDEWKKTIKAVKDANPKPE